MCSLSSSTAAPLSPSYSTPLLNLFFIQFSPLLSPRAPSSLPPRSFLLPDLIFLHSPQPSPHLSSLRASSALLWCSLTFLLLSLFIHVNLAAVAPHLWLPILSSLSPLVMSSSSPISHHPSLSTWALSPVISVYLYPGLPTRCGHQGLRWRFSSGLTSHRDQVQINHQHQPLRSDQIQTTVSSVSLMWPWIWVKIEIKFAGGVSTCHALKHFFNLLTYKDKGRQS